MAHCPYPQLRDLEACLNEIRLLEKLKEMKPGIFYLKGRGFLHFHISKEGKRWADIADGGHWGVPVELPFEPSKKIAKNFVNEVKARYARTLAKA